LKNMNRRKDRKIQNLESVQGNNSCIRVHTQPLTATRVYVM
jgi:hypothetical protein